MPRTCSTASSCREPTATRADGRGRLIVVAAAVALALAACTGGSPPAAAPSPSPRPTGPDGVLRIGTLLPQTGSLSSLGPPQADAVRLAVQDVNAAGGALGRPVELVAADSGDVTTDTALRSVGTLLADGVDAVVGAASSAVSKTVIDKITGAGVVQMSASNTSPDFSTYPDRGLYFRTAPSDTLQGKVLGERVVEDGNATVAVLALQDAYGTGLADAVQRAVDSSRGRVVSKIIYDPRATDFGAEVAQVKAAAPDAVVLIGFAEAARVITELVKQGIGPQQGTRLYVADGVVGQASLASLPPGTMAGVLASVPGRPLPADFAARLTALDPALTTFSYAAQAYDAVVLLALAAEQARSDAPAALAANLPDVSRGGVRCSTYARCKGLIDAGIGIDYDGVSGPVDLDANGDVASATIGLFVLGPDGRAPLLAQSYRSPVS